MLLCAVGIAGYLVLSKCKPENRIAVQYLPKKPADLTF